MSDPTKPEFVAIRQADEDDIISLYERMTGRKVTPEERAQVVEILKRKQGDQ